MQEDDLSSFRDEMHDVSPLPRQHQHQKRAEQRPDFVNEARQEAAQRDKRVDPNFLAMEPLVFVAPTAVLSWKKDGVQDGVCRKLRMGKYVAERMLDLHQMTVVEARQAVFNFMQTSHQQGARTVLILHGKGSTSPEPAKLKSYLNHWLPELPMTLAFHSALPQHGGTGAVYVLIKKNPTAQ